MKRIFAIAVLSMIALSAGVTTEPVRRESLGQQVSISRQPDGTVAALWRNRNRFALTVKR